MYLHRQRERCAAVLHGGARELWREPDLLAGIDCLGEQECGGGYRTYECGGRGTYKQSITDRPPMHELWSDIAGGIHVVRGELDVAEQRRSQPDSNADDGWGGGRRRANGFERAFEFCDFSMGVFATAPYHHAAGLAARPDGGYHRLSATGERERCVDRDGCARGRRRAERGAAGVRSSGVDHELHRRDRGRCAYELAGAVERKLEGIQRRGEVRSERDDERGHDPAAGKRVRSRERRDWTGHCGWSAGGERGRRDPPSGTYEFEYQRASGHGAGAGRDADAVQRSVRDRDCGEWQRELQHAECDPTGGDGAACGSSELGRVLVRLGDAYAASAGEQRTGCAVRADERI